MSKRENASNIAAPNKNDPLETQRLINEAKTKNALLKTKIAVLNVLRFSILSVLIAGVFVGGQPEIVLRLGAFQVAVTHALTLGLSIVLALLVSQIGINKARDERSIIENFLNTINSNELVAKQRSLDARIQAEKIYCCSP